MKPAGQSPSGSHATSGMVEPSTHALTRRAPDPRGPSRRIGHLALPLVAALVAAVVLPARATRADEAPLLLGVWVPAVPITSVGDKAALVTGLAAHLSDALGRPVTGRAFAHSEDFQRSLASLSFALVDAPLAAAFDSLEPLAAGRHGGRPRIRLAVYTPTAGVTPAALVRRRVAYPRSGPLTWALLERVVLERLVPLDRLVLVQAADAASALTILRLGKADAVVLATATHDRLASAAPLHQVVASQELPGVLFCVAASVTDRALAARARAAVLKFASPPAGIDGFGPFEPKVMRDLRNTLSPPPERKVTPRVVIPAVLDKLHVSGDIPRLPPDVKRAAYQALGNKPGTLALVAKLCVAVEGRVAEVSVLQASGAEPLDEFLATALRSWRYKPLVYRGRAVPYCGAKSLRVTLE